MRFNRIKVIPSAVFAALGGGLLLVGLTGCDKEGDGGGALPASTRAETSAGPRPEALSLAADEIKPDKAADAQKRLEGFLASDPKSPYRPEAHYLIGRSLAAQGMYQEGKKQHEKAIDLTDDRGLK